MRVKPSAELERGRMRHGLYRSDSSCGNNGVFEVVGPRGIKLRLIVSDEMGWEHVSVRPVNKTRCPTWDEMCFVKDLFWGEDEVVVQFHPKRSKYINNANNVLHLWKRVGAEFEMLPTILVGMKGL